MSTVETVIERALFERMAALALVPPLRVAWPNLAFTPTPGTTYLRVDHLRNDNTRFFARAIDPHLHQGTVVSPPNRNAQEATEIAGKVAEHFPADLDLYEDGIRVRIQRPPDVVSPDDRPETTWNLVVNVRYEAFA
jgi:hypothetical protein